MATPQPPLLPRPPRRFHAEDILSGQVRLAGYPFRHICITVRPAMRIGTAAMLEIYDLIMSAVEVLEPQGWVLVNVGHDGLIAYLRRRGPGTPPDS